MKFIPQQWLEKEPHIEVETNKHHTSTHIEYPEKEENEYSDFDLYDEENNERYGT